MLSSVPGQVVVDRGRQADDRDVEGGEVRPLLEQPVRARVGFPAADDEQPVDGVLLDRAGDGVEVRARPARRATCRVRRRPSAPSRSRSSSPSRRGRRPTRPWNPRRTPSATCPSSVVSRTAARTAAFMPGAAAPACRMPSRRRRCPSRGGWGSAFSSVLNVRSASLKLGPRSVERAVELARLERLVDLARIGHAFLERDPDDAVAAHAHHERLRRRRRPTAACRWRRSPSPCRGSGRTRSATPPRCMWPSTVTRTSSPSQTASAWRSALGA